MMNRIKPGALTAAFMLFLATLAAAQNPEEAEPSLTSLLSVLAEGQDDREAEAAPTPQSRTEPAREDDLANDLANDPRDPTTPGLRPEPEKTYEELQAGLAEQDLLIALGTRPRPKAPVRDGANKETSQEEIQGQSTVPQAETDADAPLPPYPNDRPDDAPVHLILPDRDAEDTLITVHADGSRTHTPPPKPASTSSGSSGSRQTAPKVDPNCPARLRALGVQFTPLPDFRKQSGCQNQGVLNITSFGSGVSLNPNVHVTCEVAEGMALWLRNSVQAEASRYFRSQVVKLSNTHGYSCRYRSGGKLSEHAFANAIDIGTFHLSNGKSVSVLKNWTTDGTAFGSNAARWFDRINDSACDYFQLVLNPRSNKAHENHFHLDQGRWKSCD